jgi:CheY-like chemotaxis protein
MLKLLLCVLEDDQIQIAAIRTVVRKEFPNADLQLATDGAECLRMIENGQLRPDVIILDINTPVMDGFQVLARLRSLKQFRYTPIIMFTTSNSQMDREKAADLRATDYVVKPEVKRMGAELRRIVEEYTGQNPSKDTWQPIDLKVKPQSQSDSNDMDEIDRLLGEF